MSVTAQAVPAVAAPGERGAAMIVPPPNRLAVIAAFGATYLVWGATYLAIRYAVESIPPLYAAGFRHLIAGCILLGWCMVKRLRPTWAQFRASAVIGMCFFLFGHGALHWAETRVPSGLASLLIAIEPIIVYAMSSFAAREWRLNASLLAGAALGLAGVGLLLGRSLLVASPGIASRTRSGRHRVGTAAGVSQRSVACKTKRADTNF